MKDRNENRPGYKKTEVGWIPDEWEMKFVDELCSFSSGHGFRKQDWSTKGLPIIRIQNLNGSQNFNYFAGRPKKNWLVNEGDLLFAWAGVKGVSFGPKIWPGPKGVLNQHIYKIHPNINFEKEWVFLSLQRVTEEIEKKAHGFKSSLLHVHQQDITRQPVPYPPLPEQGKITEILSTWDDAIDQVHQLIDAKKSRLKGLMQQLLWRKQRLPGFTEKWKSSNIGNHFERVNRKNKAGSKNALTISGPLGLINQQEYFNKRIAALDLTKYYFLKKGEFAYNKSYCNGYPLGAIKMLERYESGVVSTLYICFRIKKSSSLENDFMKYYFESGRHNRELYSIVQEGARNHGLLNVSPHDFFMTKLVLPEKKEQCAIAAVLKIAHEEITLLEAKLKALEKQKRGLMQKLLTGEVRVKV